MTGRGQPFLSFLFILPPSPWHCWCSLVCDIIDHPYRIRTIDTSQTPPSIGCQKPLRHFSQSVVNSCVGLPLSRSYYRRSFQVATDVSNVSCSCAASSDSLLSTCGVSQCVLYTCRSSVIRQTFHFSWTFGSLGFGCCVGRCGAVCLRFERRRNNSPSPVSISKSKYIPKYLGVCLIASYCKIWWCWRGTNRQPLPLAVRYRRTVLFCFVLQRLWPSFANL